MLLLDTHVILWLDAGEKLAADAIAAIESARPAAGLFVSPVSAWEIGTLVRKRRIALDSDPVSWFGRFLDQAGVNLAPLTVEAAAGSASLPEPCHGDPADRMLIATARHLGLSLMTRDRKILDYAAATGALRAVGC